MDEYSPKHYDIAQLKYLCENIYKGIASLGDSYHGWVNNQSSIVNLQLNKLIEHIAANIVILKLKYHNDSELTDQVETFLDDTFTMFSSYSINNYNIQY
ncbi:MAG: Hha toxicity modulator TomB [Sodalis sp.]|uniref:Hha toxicity modulator TomB n=1 Tax=Sodalis sp. (in: enterobacteria) TaxID=1898979 RepID=UPI003872E19B|nr:MAG: Hha toxicity modulator TomB [Sodalis sp.]